MTSCDFCQKPIVGAAYQGGVIGHTSWLSCHGCFSLAWSKDWSLLFELQQRNRTERMLESQERMKLLMTGNC